VHARLPDDWTIEHRQGQAIARAPADTARIDLIAVPRDGHRTIDTTLAAIKIQATAFTDAKITGLRRQNLAGHHAGLVEWSYQQDHKHLVRRHWVVELGDAIANISCTGQDRVPDICDAIAQEVSR
jgi:hypothetical protein